MLARHGNFWAVCLLATLTGCAASGGAGNAAAVAPGPPPGQPPANVYIAAAPVAGPPPTLPDFLGINQCKQHTAQSFGALSNFVHRLFPMLDTAFPGAEGPPPVQPISSPANLESPSPAVAAAAKIKQEEDQAQQKILALNYLATIGCGGCYPEVEDAFLAAMGDCTEEVRYAAVKAIKEAAGQPCTFCKSGACCSPDVRRKLTELSDKSGDDCCLIEPSARIRRLARIALANCGHQNLEPTPDIEGPVPTDDWEALPLSEGPREFTAETAEAEPAAFADTPVATTEAPVQAAEPVASTDKPDADNSADVEALVTKWYQTVDPTLPIEQKQTLLQNYLAKQFRRQAEESALTQLAKEEFAFHDNLKTAFATKASGQVHTAGLIDRKLNDTIAPTSYAEPVAAQAAPVDRQFSDQLVNWEQIGLVILEDERENDIAMMNEIWRLVNKRPPNSRITIDRDRLSIRTSGLVDLIDVPNMRLRKVLATTAVGSCSPVIITDREVFLVRILERRDQQRHTPNVPD